MPSGPFAGYHIRWWVRPACDPWAVMLGHRARVVAVQDSACGRGGTTRYAYMGMLGMQPNLDPREPPGTCTMPARQTRNQLAAPTALHLLLPAQWSDRPPACRWALWMEEAQGITLHALDKRRNTTYSLLGERLNGEQVRTFGCVVRRVGHVWHTSVALS